MPRLPEPPGPREGTRGRGPRLRLLIAGDSSAAGVGADHQEEALLGRTVAALEDAFTVEWTMTAETGATTKSTLARLSEISGAYDAAVTALGVNDVTRGVSPAAWRRQQAELRGLLKSRFGVRCIVACGLPPVRAFPALPQPLRWYLGRRADGFSSGLARDVRDDPAAHFLDFAFTDDVSLMASDGFHPGPGVYAEWGARVADLVMAHLDSEGRHAPGEGPLRAPR